jgi:iron only hydrogenase large subunit-like protein
MTKFDNNLSTIIGLLSRLEHFLPSSQVPPAQKQYVETFACENGGIACNGRRGKGGKNLGRSGGGGQKCNRKPTSKILAHARILRVYLIC